MGRNSRGNYPLDVRELRSAFALSESVPERARSFRVARTIQVHGGETPIQLPRDPKMLLHVVPVSAFLGEHFIDLREVDTMRQLPLIEVRLEEYRRNLDGVVSYDRREGGVAYTQLFHNGIVEAVCAAPLSEEGCFFPRWFEVAIPKAIQQYLRLLSTREVSTPIFVFFTLLGLKGVRLVFSGMWKETSDPLDRDVASFPELALEGFGFEDSHKKQFIDQVWQAFGRGEAPN